MAGKVVTVAQQKGGAGKTTLAAHLAVAWHRTGRTVGVLDIDPQGSLATWGDLRRSGGGTATPDLDCAAAAGWRIRGEVDRLVASHQIVVVDTPPHAETEARMAIRAADLLLLPVQPSPMDVWATRPTLDAAAKEKTPVLVVLNRVPPRAALTGRMAAALADLGAPVAVHRLGQRTLFAASMADGLTALDAAPHGQAAGEITALADEILTRLQD